MHNILLHNDILRTLFSRRELIISRFVSVCGCHGGDVTILFHGVVSVVRRTRTAHRWLDDAKSRPLIGERTFSPTSPADYIVTPTRYENMILLLSCSNKTRPAEAIIVILLLLAP